MKTVLVIIGLLLSVVGTCLAGWALLLDYEDHAGKSFWPWKMAVSAWFRVNILRKHPRTTPVSREVSTFWNVEASAAGIVFPAADAPMDEQFANFRKQILDLHMRVSEERREITGEINDVQQSVRDARRDAQDAVAKVDMLARELATGAVPLQILGLFLIGLGTVIAAWPVVMGWT